MVCVDQETGIRNVQTLKSLGKLRGSRVRGTFLCLLFLGVNTPYRNPFDENLNQECFPFTRINRPTVQSVNRMRHFEGLVLQNLENNHFEYSTRYFEEIRRTRIKRILQIGTFRLRWKAP